MAISQDVLKRLKPTALQAIQRRQQGTPQPALDQISSATPQGEPVQPNVTSATPSAIPQGSMSSPQGLPQPTTPSPMDNEAELILKALDNRLKTLGKMGR